MFYDVEHVIDLEDAHLAVLENNTIVGITPDGPDPGNGTPQEYSVVNLVIVNRNAPGRGAHLEGNIIVDVSERIFGQPDTNRNGSPGPLSDLIVSNTLLSAERCGDVIGQRPGTFTYSADDGVVDSVAATVTITVMSVNDPPVAAGESYELTPGANLSIPAPGILTNDFDVEGDALTAELVSDVTQRTLQLNADGSFSYDAPLVEGDFTFTYPASDAGDPSNIVTVAFNVVDVNFPPTATINVSPINDAPVAQSDSYSVEGGEVLVIDNQGELLFYESFSEPTLPIVLPGTTPDLGSTWFKASNGGSTRDMIVAGSIDTAETLAPSARGGKLHITGDDRSRSISTLIPSGVGASGTTIYASLLVDVSSPARSRSRSPKASRPLVVPGWVTCRGTSSISPPR